MAMYANVQWTKVSNTAQQPAWAVFQVVYDEAGNIVYDENGQPVVAPILKSPPNSVPAPPTPAGDSTPPIPVVFP